MDFRAYFLDQVFYGADGVADAIRAVSFGLHIHTGSFIRRRRADIGNIFIRIDWSCVTYTRPSGVHNAIRAAKHCENKSGRIRQEVHGQQAG